MDVEAREFESFAAWPTAGSPGVPAQRENMPAGTAATTSARLTGGERISPDMRSSRFRTGAIKTRRLSPPSAACSRPQCS